MSIYFDADSSTFGGSGRRLPLRVEVYVDGQKVMEADDPEKRQFEIRRLPEGEHEVEIVPFVGGAPAEPRRRVVRIDPGQGSRYKAVLRREDGISRVKFREQD
jgi:hypothetical protein